MAAQERLHSPQAERMLHKQDRASLSADAPLHRKRENTDIATLRLTTACVALKSKTTKTGIIMKQRIREKIFRNRWRLNYSLGQILESSRGLVFWVYPDSGFRYYLNGHNGHIIKEKDDGFLVKGNIHKK